MLFDHGERVEALPEERLVEALLALIGSQPSCEPRESVVPET